MKKSENIRKEIQDAERAKQEAQSKTDALSAKRDETMAKLGDKLLGDPGTSTEELEQIQNEVDRLALIVAAHDRNIAKLKDNLRAALENEKKAEREKLSNQGFEIIKKMLPMILELNKSADELLNLHSAYTVRSGNYRTRAVTQGLPAGAIFAQTDGWLNIAEGAAPKLKAYVLEKGIPNRVERMKIRTEKKGRDGKQKS